MHEITSADKSAPQPTLTPVLDSLRPQSTVDLIKAIVSANPAQVDGYETDRAGNIRQWYDGPGCDKLQPIKRSYLATLAGVEYQVCSFLRHKDGNHDDSMYLYTRDIATDKIQMHVVFFTEMRATQHALMNRMFESMLQPKMSVLLPSRSEASLICAVLGEYEVAERACYDTTHSGRKL